MVSWPILRSSSAIRCSSVNADETPRRPMPGKANSPRARHSPRHRSNRWGLSSRCRPTSPTARPPSISRIAAIFKSRLYILRAQSIHLSIQCIWPLNFVSHFWGALQLPTPHSPLPTPHFPLPTSHFPFPTTKSPTASTSQIPPSSRSAGSRGLLRNPPATISSVTRNPGRNKSAWA
jgi:hypothetical protein